MNASRLLRVFFSFVSKQLVKFKYFIVKLIKKHLDKNILDKFS